MSDLYVRGMNRKRIFLLGGLAFGVILIAYFATPFFGHPPIPAVPKSAGLVWSNERGAWVAYDLQVRFSAPYEDSVRFAEEAIENYRRDEWKEDYNGELLDYPRVTIERGKYLTSGRPSAVTLKMDSSAKTHEWWFRPDTIQNGVFIGSDLHGGPDIWIDKDWEILYYKVTD